MKDFPCVRISFSYCLDMQTNFRQIPNRYAVKLSQGMGVEWKDESFGNTYTRWFLSQFEMLEWVADTFGRSFSNKIAKIELSENWTGKLKA